MLKMSKNLKQMKYKYMEVFERGHLASNSLKALCWLTELSFIIYFFSLTSAYALLWVYLLPMPLQRSWNYATLFYGLRYSRKHNTEHFSVEEAYVCVLSDNLSRKMLCPMEKNRLESSLQ